MTKDAILDWRILVWSSIASKCIIAPDAGIALLPHPARPGLSAFRVPMGGAECRVLASGGGGIPARVFLWPGPVISLHPHPAPRTPAI